MYYPQPNPRVSVFQFGCKPCRNCGWLNASYATWCGIPGCGSPLGYVPTPIQEAAKQGIKICPTCGDWYSQQAWFCRRCSCPLQNATYSLPSPPLQENQEELPCPKCSKSKLQTPFCDYCGRLGAFQIKIKETLSYSKHVVNLELASGNRAIYCPVLLDSGAHSSLFHGYIADMLGIDLSHAPISYCSGIIPGSAIVYAAQLNVLIARKPYQIPVSFSYGLAFNAYNMLGDVGFFDRFNVSFEEDASEEDNIVISEKAKLRVKGWKNCPFCGSERKHTVSNFCWSCGASLKVEPVLNSQLLPQEQHQAYNQIVSLNETNCQTMSEELCQ